MKLCSVLSITMLLGMGIAMAQPGDDPPDNPPVPISGIGYLLALGGALGVKKIYDIRKNNRSR